MPEAREARGHRQEQDTSMASITSNLEIASVRFRKAGRTGVGLPALGGTSVSRERRHR
jgi:hypothetical protein